GSTVSIVTVSVSELELPALSSTEQLMGWLPSPVTDGVHVLAGPLGGAGAGTAARRVGAAARPLVASLAVTSIGTGLVMFQPFEPSALWLTEIVGSTVSIVTVSASLLGFVAMSETEQLTGWLPSPVTDRVHGLAGPLSVAGEPSTVQLGAAARPDPASLAATVTVTGSLTFQPFEPSAVW